MRYCRDCEHFDNAAAPTRPPVCGRFKKTFVASESPVYGPTTQFSAPDCATARAEGGQCGPKGRFFVARPGTAPWLEEREKKREEIFAEVHEELEPTRKTGLFERIFGSWHF